MSSTSLLSVRTIFMCLALALLSAGSFAQTDTTAAENIPRSKSEFWRRTQFGGGLGLSFGTDYTNVMVAPSAIYNFSDYFAAGIGLQGSYIKVREQYDSFLYGGSLIGLFNPIEEIQVSAELEQLRVNTEFDYLGESYDDNFWNTALFLGVGYRAQNVTIGIRYNVLHDDNDRVYYDPFMPFVRVYF
ncbi:MAG TPA: hypothetical protein VF581_08570 [Flavobacterium sp.]